MLIIVCHLKKDKSISIAIDVAVFFIIYFIYLFICGWQALYLVIREVDVQKH